MSWKLFYAMEPNRDWKEMPFSSFHWTLKIWSLEYHRSFFVRWYSHSQTAKLGAAPRSRWSFSVRVPEGPRFCTGFSNSRYHGTGSLNLATPSAERDMTTFILRASKTNEEPQGLVMIPWKNTRVLVWYRVPYVQVEICTLAVLQE
jgi:hypothetical protein